MGWDDEPRGPVRDPRMGAPGASSRRNPMPQSAFDPYQPYGSTRVPVPGATGQWATDQAGWTSTQMTAVGHHHHFSLFHDGNAGHLWRGEVASLLGDAVFATGMLIWLADLTESPYMVALALVLLGAAWVLAGPLAAPLTRAAEPGRGLAWLGRIRFALALGFIPMHFHTIYPVVFALIFGISLCGRLRGSLHIAAFRTCLGAGELERVSSDLYIGGAVVAVVGPLLATVAYTLMGERILLVSIFAAVCYLLASNSDGFLDALPEPKRAFLHVQPDEDDLAALMDEDSDDERLADPEMRRELALPEWYQVMPSTLRQAFGELRAGIGLAGGLSLSQSALLALCMLGLVGGGLSALEIFFLQDRLALSSFYFGPLLAAEAGGLALGALIGDSVASRGQGRPALIAGVIGTGLALIAMALIPMFLVVLVCALFLGIFNALAVTGARTGLLVGFMGYERRSIASAETWLVALSGIVGAVLFTLFYAGVSGVRQLPSSASKLPFPGLPVALVILGTGVSLVLAAVIFIVLLARRQRARAASARSVADSEYDDGYDSGYDGESAYMPAADGGWDDDEQGGWGDEYDDESLSSYGPAQNDRYGGGAPGRSSYRAPNRGGGLLSRQNANNDDDDDSSPRRGGAPGGSRNRW